MVTCLYWTCRFVLHLHLKTGPSTALWFCWSYLEGALCALCPPPKICRISCSMDCMMTQLGWILISYTSIECAVFIDHANFIEDLKVHTCTSSKAYQWKHWQVLYSLFMATKFCCLFTSLNCFILRRVKLCFDIVLWIIVLLRLPLRQLCTITHGCLVTGILYNLTMQLLTESSVWLIILQIHCKSYH